LILCQELNNYPTLVAMDYDRTIATFFIATKQIFKRIRMEKEKAYGVWMVRNDASIFDRAEAWCKDEGKPSEFDTKEAVGDYVKEISDYITANVHYYVREKGPEPGAIKKRVATAGESEGKKQKKNRECR